MLGGAGAGGEQDKTSFSDLAARETDRKINSKVSNTDILEKTVNDTVIMKAKKVVRHKILLLAYAR